VFAIFVALRIVAYVFSFCVALSVICVCASFVALWLVV